MGVGVATHTFTYKVDMPDASVVEIETKISEDDWDRLIPLAETRLYKERFSMTCESGEQWDIDAFFTKADPHPQSEGDPYAIVAECEMQGDQRAPEVWPHIVKTNLVHSVRPGDKAFSSRSMANIEKTTQIMQILMDSWPGNR